MRDFLIPLVDPYRRDAAVAYAADLAVRFDASLTALYAVQPFVGGPEFNSPAVIAEAVGYLLAQRRAVTEGAAPFVDWAQRRGVPSARWESSDAVFAHAVASISNWYDVVVLQAEAGAEAGGAATLGEILLTCGRPCIVVRNEAAASLRCIAVAWNGSVECVRAVRSSLELLQQADEVLILRSDISQAPAARSIDRYLERHGVRVVPNAPRIDDRAPGETLLLAADAVGADLLVMGAYGHSRFSEWVFGGATRHVLEHARLPLFLRH